MLVESWRMCERGYLSEVNYNLEEAQLHSHLIASLFIVTTWIRQLRGPLSHSFCVNPQFMRSLGVAVRPPLC